MTPTLESTLFTLAIGQTIKVCRINPHGSLYARKDVAGAVTFSWRWTYQGDNDSETLGLWDRTAHPSKLEPSQKGWSVKAAIRQAESWALEHEATIQLG